MDEDNEKEGAVTGDIERMDIREEDMTKREEEGSKEFDLKKRGRKKRIEEIKRRERSNSTSILDYMKGNRTDCELGISKRKREEWEKEMEIVFKKSNRLERTPPDERRQREETKEEVIEKKSEGTGELIAILKEIKEEMVETRKEIKEMKMKVSYFEKGWKVKEKRLEERMEKIEKKIKEVEAKKKEEKEIIKKDIEEVVAGMMETWRRPEKPEGSQESKIAEETKKEVRKLKRIIEDKERKERKNNIVIRGLKNEKGDARETGKEFLEKEFRMRGKIKHIRTEGKEKREVLIVEMEDWQAKENIMTAKSRLRGRNIFIDHDLTKEEREVQRKLRERVRKEREAGKKAKVGYRKVIIEGKVYMWNEEEEEVKERTYFGKTVKRGD